jgi:homoserine kinase type II
LAVYTELHKEQLIKLLKLYDIGNLISYEGITEGIENSNFFVKTTHGKFILTIFENRVNKNELPFFLEIMTHLSKKKFLCPYPIVDLKNNYIHELSGKPSIIVNFLEGKSKINIRKEDCYKVGIIYGLHA